PQGPHRRPSPAIRTGRVRLRRRGRSSCPKVLDRCALGSFMPRLRDSGRMSGADRRGASVHRDPGMAAEGHGFGYEPVGPKPVSNELQGWRGRTLLLVEFYPLPADTAIARLTRDRARSRGDKAAAGVTALANLVIPPRWTFPPRRP